MTVSAFSRAIPRSTLRFALAVHSLTAFATSCMPAAKPAHSALTVPGASNLALADALEGLIALHADTPGDRRYAYERVKTHEPATAADALGRAIVAGRLAQVAGLSAPGLVAEVERYARLSSSLDPALRYGAAQRILGTLYVMAPASLLAHGDSETGLDLLEQVVKSFPAYPTNHLRLAEAYVSLGDPEPARPHLCFCRSHRAELRADEQQLLDELSAQTKVTACP
jgi:hypothetical protein